ncbi:hypothetical protein DFH28DRAFT_1086230 [Melampsora americana]|nr:hypothetical protein DFH28DRAFT_1086230 [Melampsora americana]
MVYGSARNQLSRRQYETVRSAVSLAGLKLPTYKTLKALLKRIKKILGLNLVSTTSPLNNKCYSLPLKELLRLDLAKPHVSQNLTFYPQVSKDGLVKEFSHCEKWLNGFQPHLRAPMVYTMFGHFYLYEPVQLISGELAVPTHFFYFEDDLVAKCLPLKLVNHNHQGGVPRMEISQEERVERKVNISHFRNTFENIILPGGYNLKALYGNTLYRINCDGEMIQGIQRDWHETKRVTEMIWKDSLKPNMVSKVDAIQKAFGLKDTMLQPFIEDVRKVQRQHNQNEVNIMGCDFENRLGNRILRPSQQSATAHQYLSLNHAQMHNVQTAILKNNQQAKVGDFVAVLSPHHDPHQFIGRIRSLWSPIDSTNDLLSHILVLDCGSTSYSCHPYYGMRSLQIESRSVYVYIDEVSCTINVQHNCHDSNCQTEGPSSTSLYSIRPNVPLSATHKHNNTNLYIINSASLFNGEAHHEWANIQPQRVSPEMWSQAIHVGLARWKESPSKATKKNT